MQAINQRTIEVIVSEIVGKFPGDKKTARDMARGAKLIRANNKGRGALYLPTEAGLTFLGKYSEQEIKEILAFSPSEKATAEKIEALIGTYAKARARIAKCERLAKKYGVDLDGALMAREATQRAVVASQMGVAVSLQA